MANAVGQEARLPINPRTVCLRVFASCRWFELSQDKVVGSMFLSYATEQGPCTVPQPLLLHRYGVSDFEALKKHIVAYILRALPTQTKLPRVMYFILCIGANPAQGLS